MVLLRTLVANSLFFSVMLLSSMAQSEYITKLPPIAKTEFISIKKNPLARSLQGLSALVGKFSVDGLIQYTLILQPEDGMPAAGWPVIIFNHGFHPEPFMNGRRSEDGANDRPGDYYREIPQALARQGFLVIAPDYRGHNDSAGAEFTLREDSPNWYARDVLGVIAALEGTDLGNMQELFMLGHSMGGQVTLLAAAALGDRLKGASIWSTYVPAAVIAGARQSKSDPFGQLQLQLEQIYSPMNIHHAEGDPATAYEGSVLIARQLEQLENPSTLYLYQSTNHLFTGDNLQRAIRRDIELFRRVMRSQDRPQD
jgi:pimeloyl-ACP methyl ester carboxylesterase